MRFHKLFVHLTRALVVIMIAGGSAMAASPTTPIEHVVVIFQENVSFDHYFATYPVAKNTDGTAFTAQPGTPTVNGLTPGLITGNPNISGLIGKPFRLATTQPATCDQDHEYGDEQSMFDNGSMDNFLKFNTGTCTVNKGFDGSEG